MDNIISAEYLAVNQKCQDESVTNKIRTSEFLEILSSPTFFGWNVYTRERLLCSAFTIYIGKGNNTDLPSFGGKM